ncbi:MAG: lipocalin family protein [Planctomycetota bacterium]
MTASITVRGAQALAALVCVACSSRSPLPTASRVEIDRFMGNWYVQGHVPASSEKNAHNAVESYAQDDRGRILTTYAFRDGGFDGDVEVMEPTGFVADDDSNAEWGMKFFRWLPIRMEYLVAYVDDDYSETIVGRTKRDYAWIMTREPEISDARYERLVQRVVELGYAREAIRRVPQRWPDPEHPAARANGDLARFTRSE